MPEGHHAAPGPDGPGPELRADCGSCFALCCVVPTFSASADFAIDKAAGEPCPNLLSDFRCSIHADLRQQGFPGCTVYDCFGAGQQVAQATVGGRDWRRTPDLAEEMFAVFGVMRELHELLWYLSEALTLQPARSLFDELGARSTRRRPSPTALPTRWWRADLIIGKTFRDTDLSGANLRGAYPIGADLRGADLSLFLTQFQVNAAQGDLETPRPVRR